MYRKTRAMHTRSAVVSQFVSACTESLVCACVLAPTAGTRESCVASTLSEGKQNRTEQNRTEQNLRLDRLVSGETSCVCGRNSQGTGVVEPGT